ncbi:MAG: ATP-dependent helicase [Caldilineaceae bacterium]|nr:ATP-dependent helicase [Caldilineaceae bacterium]
MKSIHPDQWVPVGVDSLESAAHEVVRSSKNTLVVAGPGAGKSELLAQRASYLLETATCPAPRRILAISFKRDAAKNLKDRVEKRCGDKAIRFDSLTLDAFAKSLVDRFRSALPQEWRPCTDYEIIVKSPTARERQNWMVSKAPPSDCSPLDIDRYSDDRIRCVFDDICHGHLLPYDDPNIHPHIASLGRLWWKESLGDEIIEHGSLSFPMLSRLAAFLLRNNPKIALALRMTYAYVFLDEFQDTTSAQYDLVTSVFHGSDSVLTAVGDDKQRIMVWAGAMIDIFDVFRKDFDADRVELLSNYRSAPELVRMQHIIAKTLAAETAPTEAMKLGIEGSCEILEFNNPECEAYYLAEIIEAGLGVDGMTPRDFGILVRQSTGAMISVLKLVLAERGIKLRDESQLQDLLAEPVVQFLLSILRLATRKRDAEAWSSLTETLAVLLGLDQAEESAQIEQEAIALLEYARTALKDGCPISNLPAGLIAVLGEAPFRITYRQYSQGAYLGEVVDKLADELQQMDDSTCAAGQIVDDLIGDDVVPAMTIHKSKGLEFRTVIFLGLEDSQWWNFTKQSDEEKRSFFVAFSRAIENVYFTYSDMRNNRWGKRKRQQQENIGDLYTILEEAGVSKRNYR